MRRHGALSRRPPPHLVAPPTMLLATARWRRLSLTPSPATSAVGAAFRATSSLLSPASSVHTALKPSLRARRNADVAGSKGMCRVRPGWDRCWERLLCCAGSGTVLHGRYDSSQSAECPSRGPGCTCPGPRPRLLFWAVRSGATSQLHAPRCKVPSYAHTSAAATPTPCMCRKNGRSATPPARHVHMHALYVACTHVCGTCTPPETRT